MTTKAKETPSLSTNDNVFHPRPHQQAACRKILDARREGWPGFLLGDLTGLGKTLSAWLAILAMAEDDVLIICPSGAIPQWQRTMRRSGPHTKTVSILNYERTKSLLSPPSETKGRSTRGKNRELAKRGTLKRRWSIVVLDESHRLRNPNAQQTMVCRQVADAAAFTIYMSATAGQSPHELSYLGRLFGHAAGMGTDTLDGFRTLMKQLKIGKARGRWKNWHWEPNDRDRETMASLLYKGSRAIGLRRRPADIAGWPEVQRELAPIALDAPSRKLYEASWKAFRTEFGLAGGSTRTPAGRVAELRFRQKGSLLRVPGTVDHVEMLIENGQQVAISVAFLETSAALVALLASRSYRVGAINGEQSGHDNERERLAFQTGALDAIVFTVTEAISLHEREMTGGERRRSLVIHDMRHSAIQLQQIEGRCHRDGQGALIYYAYAEDTVDETVAVRVLRRMATMDGMAGDDITMFEEILQDMSGPSRQR